MAHKPTSIKSAAPDILDAANRAVDGAGERGSADVEPGLVHPVGRSDRTQDHDLTSIKPQPDKIAARLEKGQAVLVAGEVKGDDGKPHRQWVSVDHYDAKTKTFYVHEPGAKQTTEWDAAKLTSFASGKLGGEAIAVEPLPRNHASQAEIDAIVAAAPASMRDKAATAVPLVLDEATKAGVTDRKQVAYILASAQHESHLGNGMTELGNGKSADGHDHYFDKYDGRMGNTHPHDGEKYKGRGYVQVTGHDNYQDWSNKLDLDLVNHPERITTPDIAAKTMVEGMRDGSFTTKKLADYEKPTRPHYDYVNARAIVNGDRDVQNPGEPAPHGQMIAGYAKNYEGALLKAQIKEQLPRLAGQGVNLPEPAQTADWNGTPRTGTFVKVDDNTCAMSAGRGQYVAFDVQRDLHGVAPPEGKAQVVDAKGHVQDPPVVEQSKAAVR